MAYSVRPRIVTVKPVADPEYGFILGVKYTGGHGSGRNTLQVSVPRVVQDDEEDNDAFRLRYWKEVRTAMAEEIRANEKLAHNFAMSKSFLSTMLLYRKYRGEITIR